MLELKNNKHNTYYRCPYLYIVNAVIFKRLLTLYLKRDLAKKTTTTTIIELIELFVQGWGERYCNNLNYVKNNAFFKQPSMRACSSTPPKQNQDFVKEHNRTPLMHKQVIKKKKNSAASI